jgi:large subunit ribosomal protein L24
MKLRIKKSDTVKVIAGNDKGKTGRVLDVNPESMRILVEQVNVRAKHEKPTKNNQKGGIVHKEMPIHYSNVMLLDSDNNNTRIGIKTKEESNGKIGKIRIARTNSKEI